MILLRTVPLVLNLILYFGFEEKASAEFFVLTIPFFILGNWFLLLYSLYQFFVGNHDVGALFVFLFILMTYKKKKRASERKQNDYLSGYETEDEDDSGDRDANYGKGLRPVFAAHGVDSWSHTEGEDEVQRSEYKKKKNGSSQDDDASWEQKKREDDAHFYRKNGGPQWRVDAADDDLGRSQWERDYEDEKYEQKCNGCDEPESRCKCCSRCDRHPCECCRECGEANCRCCYRCGRYRCECD